MLLFGEDASHRFVVGAGVVVGNRGAPASAERAAVGTGDGRGRGTRSRGESSLLMNRPAVGQSLHCSAPKTRRGTPHCEDAGGTPPRLYEGGAIQ